MNDATLIHWLAEGGLRNLPLERIVDGYARRLNAAGVPVARAFVGTSTLHPMIRARSMIWERSTGPATRFEFHHFEIDAPQLRQSPFMPMLSDRVFARRVDLADPSAVAGVPVFEELHAAGMTEWLGRVFPFGELTPRIGDAEHVQHVGELWFVCSFATDRPGGFTADQIAALDASLPVFAVAAKASTMLSTSHGLLAAYLGDDPAARVLAGSVRRGEVQSVEAVLFFADLQGFTALADALPGAALIDLLDSHLGSMVQPVVAHGGEVLKFMGDGLLATFAVVGADREGVCADALRAAGDVLERVERQNAARAAAGKPTAIVDISLHIGRVLYGNVGGEARLDFTVIGPAVNEAARIEALCGPLDRRLLVSQAFAAACGADRKRLVSLGHHRLRGVREPAELFTLA
ncbi:MAG: adenylate/guanylate cyclase domain-containing protein [Enhydrobacter sp.]|nr:MAG: adenylate/guanylate cyclase domain-containing protein [Enhydrobacter sp.]